MKTEQISTLRRCAVVACFGALAFGTARSQQAPARVDFRRDVLPIFRQYCVECHGPTQQMHGYRLDRRRDAKRGAMQAVIRPGESAISRLYLKLIGNQYGPRMPLTGPLDPAQIEVIRAWIDQGAEWPDDLAGDAPLPPPDLTGVRLAEALRDGDAKTFESIAKATPGAGSLRGPDGTTPLMRAVLYADAGAVRLLLAGGADPNARNDAGATALMWATDDPKKTRLLLERGADVNAVSADGRTALQIAAMRAGNREVVRLLLDRGADPSAKSPAGIGYATVLSEAARAGDADVVRLLLERGADAKGAGVVALLNGARFPACLDLLARRADPGTLTGALLAVAPLGDQSAIRTLVDLGADVKAKDKNGNTALTLAAGSDAIPTEAVRTLLRHGADVGARNAEGRTALDVARLRGATPVVELLTSAGAKPGEAASPAPAPSPTPAVSARAALARSLPLLQSSAATFMRKATCLSCHNNSLTAVTVAAARESGFPVDEPAARDQRSAMGAYLATVRDRYLQGSVPGGPAILAYSLLGLAAERYPADATTDALAVALRALQYADGRWQQSTHRPPMETSDAIDTTANAVRVLRAYAPKTRRAEFDASVDRAASFLATARPATTQERAFRLLGLSWAGRRPDDAVVRGAARDLAREQRPDGGWSQLPSLASDAYATGQALVALRQAGGLDPSDPVVARGVAFLLRTQVADGSWYVRSRSVPIQPYFESGFPYGRDQWISAAATNWASTALALSERPRAGERSARARRARGRS